MTANSECHLGPYQSEKLERGSIQNYLGAISKFILNIYCFFFFFFFFFFGEGGVGGGGRGK